MKGPARRVRSATEGQKIVLRFRLETSEGRAVPVELRGAEIHGDLDEGDIIEVPTEVAGQGDALVHLQQVRNLTTGSLVRAWNPSRIQQARSLAGKEILSATVGAGVTLTIGGLQRIGQDDQPPNQTSSTSTPDRFNTTRSPPSTSGGPSGTTTSGTETTAHGSTTSSISGIPSTTIRPPVYPEAPPYPEAPLNYPILFWFGLLLVGAVLWAYIRFERSRHSKGKKPFYPTVLAFGVGVFLALRLLTLIS
jgi:hypothetical protein